MVPSGGSFWIGVIFLLVIHSGILAFSKHLLSCRVSISWPNKKKKLKLEPMYATTALRFLIRYFLSVTLSNSRSIYASGPPYNPCNSFFMLFIHLAFLFPYFTLKYISSFTYTVVGLSSCIFHLLDAGIAFRYFGMFRFVFITWYF